MTINHIIPSLDVGWLGMVLGSMIYGLKDKIVLQRQEGAEMRQSQRVKHVKTY
jgi:hypothetical protein